MSAHLQPKHNRAAAARLLQRLSGVCNSASRRIPVDYMKTPHQSVAASDM
jgi:transposase-like protein